MSESQVRLISIKRENGPDVVKWKNQVSTKRYLFGNGVYTLEQFYDEYEQLMLTGKAYQFMIQIKETREFIGTIFIRNIHRFNQKGEIGYYIGEDTARNKGYGTEAISLAVTYGFKVLGLHKIYMQAFEDNIASIRCCEKVGFVHEGLHRDDIYKDGDFKHVVTMSILQGEKEEDMNE